MKNKINGSECAPRDGTLILCDFGYPWWIAAMWSEANGQWVAANVQVSVCDGKQDPYFENEWFDDDELIKWMELPKAI